MFVIKQSWRPSDVLSEGDLYDKAKASDSKYVGAIDLCEEVLVEGQKDDTVSLIRQNVAHKQPAEPEPKAGRYRDERRESHMHVACVQEDQILFSIYNCCDLVARVRTRVLLSTYGWPLKYFSSLQELVRVMRDAIKGIFLLQKGCCGLTHLLDQVTEIFSGTVSCIGI